MLKYTFLKLLIFQVVFGVSSCGRAEDYADRSYIDSVSECLKKVNEDKLEELAREHSRVREFLRDGRSSPEDTRFLAELFVRECSELDFQPEKFWQRSSLILVIQDGQVTILENEP